MRCLVVLLAFVAFGACAVSKQAADQDILTKQQNVIQLLQNIGEDIPNQQLQELGINYDIVSNALQYQNPIIVKYYAGVVDAGLVQPKGTVFSSSNGQLRKELSLLYKILMGAKNYQTFLQTAAWARVNVNEGQFVKALIGAVLMRPDTQGIILPPLYEIFPQYHLDSRIIQEAQDIAIQKLGQDIPQQNINLIPVNYSALLDQEEQQLSYYTQDVGLASYYGYLNLVSFILGEEDQQQQQQQPLTQQQYQQQIVGEYLHQVGQGQQNIVGHGAKYLFLHQQLLAHYELNRLTNGLGPIQEITNYNSVQSLYHPHLRTLNGLEFPSRPENLQLQPQKNELIQYVSILEQRLMDAIESGHVITPQGIFLSLYQPQGVNILGSLIEGGGKSVNPRFYGSLQVAARKLLGNVPEVQNIWETPSVLELGQTAVHDPVFYKLYKRIMKLYNKYQESLPSYQWNDLILSGVTIQDVEISQLVTLFNDFFIDLNNAVPQFGQQQQQHQHQQQQQQAQQKILAQLKRLDHKPYQYQINVYSEQAVPNSVVRVFLGPKYDHKRQPISISQGRQYFVQLDQFIHNLQQGQNQILRNSQQAPGLSFDWPSVQEIQEGVQSGITSQGPFYITKPHQIFSFPARLSLPKGQPQGFPLQLLVVVSAPGPLNVPYGPVIPEDSLIYQNQQHQIVSPEQYQQLKQQQSQLPHVSGIQQNVEVLPENWVGQKSQIQYALAKMFGGQSSAQQLKLQYNQMQQGQQIPIPGYQALPYQRLHSGYSPIQQGFSSNWQKYGNQNIQHHVPLYQTVPGVQGVQGVQQPGVVGLQGVVQDVQGVVQDVQGIQQDVNGVRQVVSGVRQVVNGEQQRVSGVQQSVQGLQGMPQGIQQGAVHGVIPGMYSVHGAGQQQIGSHGQHNIPIAYNTQPIQGGWQSQFTSGIVGNVASGQLHAGGFQGIHAQQHTVQDQSVHEHYQNQPISDIIGGAISLDGKPLGFPLDRPLSVSALSVPNIFVKDVLVYHEGQTTNEIVQ
ncbi:hexamerin 110 [Halictus rubicundus]|uniref:hexamerin 110 n=1 Tax=Halictus rubicundus TaxID=77578 RepID=UPI0040362BB4